MENSAIRQGIERKRFNDRYRDLNIGRRFESATFANYLPVNKDAEHRKQWCQRYAETFHERMQNGDSIILCGRPGTGKNHLAAAICKTVVDMGLSAVHTTAIKLVRKVKETWGRGAGITEQEAINLFLDPDLLVIDEVGVQFGSQAEQIILMEVINGRYADLRPTILISNLEVEDKEVDGKTVQGISGVLGSQIVDRFYEGLSAVLQFGWDSYRRRAR